MQRFLYKVLNGVNSRFQKRGLRRRPHAVGLAELLIAMAVFGAVLSLVGQMAVRGFRYSQQSLDSQYCMRDAALVNDLIGRELRHCEAIVWPEMSDWDRGRRVSSERGKTLLLACRLKLGEDSDRIVVGYRYLGAKGTLERCVYRASHRFTERNLNSASGIIARRVLLRGVTSFSFWSCSRVNCYGQSMLGAGFRVLPSANRTAYSKAYANLGNYLCTEVQVRGL